MTSVTETKPVSNWFATLIVDRGSPAKASSSTKDNAPHPSMDDYFHAKEDGSAPSIPPPTHQMTPEQLMLVIEKLISIAGGAVMSTLRTQIKNHDVSSKSVLKENLVKFDEMIKKVEKERASSKLNKIFGWVVKIATLIVGAAVLGAVVASTGGIGFGGGLVAAMAVMSLFGSVVDIASEAQKDLNQGDGFSVAGWCGCEEGGAVLTANGGALLGALANRFGGSGGLQIGLTVLGSVIQTFLTMKYSPTAVAQSKMMKTVGHMSEVSGKFGSALDGFGSVCQGSAAIEQAGYSLDISNLRADMNEQESALAVTQDHINHDMELCQMVWDVLEDTVKAAAQSLSTWAASMLALAEEPQHGRAVA